MSVVILVFVIRPLKVYPPYSQKVRSFELSLRPKDKNRQSAFSIDFDYVCFKWICRIAKDTLRMDNEQNLNNE